MFLKHASKPRSLRLLFAAFLLVVQLFAGFGFSPAAASGSGVVYVMSNSAAGNSILVYDRASDGTLAFAGEYATGGLGTGAGLGSQGALVLSANGRWLFAVNAGSNEISILSVQGNQLQLRDVAPSGGELPISLTNRDNLLFVLNGGGAGNLTGFAFDRTGNLIPLDGSTHPLSNGGSGDSVGPAQIEFTPDGKALVVTEKMTNLIDIYSVDAHGQISNFTANPSAGETPFGFAFARGGQLVVSEAFGGAPDASALSSYQIDGSQLLAISPVVNTNQTAACWVVVTDNGKYAYTTNTGSSSISSYSIGRNGSLTLLDSRAGETGDGSSPIDMALSNNSTYLYALSGGTHTVVGFQVNADGSLTQVDSVDVPAGAVGIAAQ